MCSIHVLFLFLTYPAFGLQSNKSNCECVPFYLCANGTINTNGAGIIDIRMRDGECTSYLEICCSQKNIQIITPAVPPPPEKQACGYRNPEGVGYQIKGNKDNEAQFGEFPWMIALFGKGKYDQKHFYRCGASLIHAQVALTAAHCVSESGNHFKIRAGEWDSQTNQEMYRHEDREVSSIVIHPQFTQRGLKNDIALLFLNKSLNITSHINTVCLPRQDFIASGNGCFVTGWGKDRFDENEQYQVILKRIEVPVMPKRQCAEAFRDTRLGPGFRLHRSFMCAGGEEGKDACTGDGGSPLVCPIEGEEMRYQQVGIVAWGIGCGVRGIPGAYVDVAHFRNWIDQEMKRRHFKTSTYRS